MRPAQDIENALAKHGDTVLRVTTLYLRERADREDLYQETFLRYARSEKEFCSEEHERAWLIRVAANLCKDQLKRAGRRIESLDAYETDSLSALATEQAADAPLMAAQEPQPRDVTAALAQLEEKYRMPLYLKYYENYSSPQIAALLGIPENTVYTNLSRGKKLLKGVLAHGR